MYNKETVIRLNTLDDVQEFVGAASKCDFDIDLKYRQILIDAKSLLGVIGIGINNDFKVCYMGDDQAFDNVVDKFHCSVIQLNKILWESFFLELSFFLCSVY